jgi:hypothetical protein
MRVTSDSTLLNGLTAKHLVEYLALSNWKQRNHTKWFIFEGDEDAEGKPLEIVFPRDQGASDIRVYFASVINLLSALRDEEPQDVVRRIKHYDSDIFMLFNIDGDTVPLDRAVDQMEALQSMVGYAARSESDPRPHYENYQTPFALRIIKHCRFEHTVRGSFGFAVTSRIINPMSRVTYEQHPLPDMPPTTVMVPPEERSVMERIVRGLRLAETAAQQMDPQLIVREYSSGFNSGMCRAAMRLKADHYPPIECRILWSPKLKPSADVADVQKMAINERARNYLQDASEKLRVLQPETVTIRGNVVGLLSRGNPFSDRAEVERLVVIRWVNRPSAGRPVDIIVALNKEEYALALDAHRKWTPVQVTGVAAKVGNEWRLAQAHNFGFI